MFLVARDVAIHFTVAHDSSIPTPANLPIPIIIKTLNGIPTDLYNVNRVSYIVPLHNFSLMPNHKT